MTEPEATGPNWKTGGSIWTVENAFLLERWPSSGKDCPEMWWNLHPWETWSWATYSRSPYWNREVKPDDLLRSLPTSAPPWFCILFTESSKSNHMRSFSWGKKSEVNLRIIKNSIIFFRVLSMLTGKRQKNCNIILPEMATYIDKKFLSGSISHTKRKRELLHYM